MSTFYKYDQKETNPCLEMQLHFPILNCMQVMFINFNRILFQTFAGISEMWLLGPMFVDYQIFFPIII